jgi:hypothetical protein
MTIQLKIYETALIIVSQSIQSSNQRNQLSRPFAKYVSNRMRLENIESEPIKWVSFRDSVPPPAQPLVHSVYRGLSLLTCILYPLPSPTFAALPHIFDDLSPPFSAKELGLASLPLSVAPLWWFVANSRFSSFFPLFHILFYSILFYFVRFELTLLRNRVFYFCSWFTWYHQTAVISAEYCIE